MNENTFCVSFKNFYMKDNIKNAHWVGNTKLKTLYTYGCFKRKSC